MKIFFMVIGVVACGFLVLNFNTLIVSDAGRNICVETYDPPHGFFFNGDFRSCLLDKDHQRGLVERRRQSIIKEKNESLQSLSEINNESMKTVKLIGRDRFIEFQQEFPPITFSPGEPDPFLTGEYPSRLIKREFERCTFRRWRSSDMDPDPEEFFCSIDSYGTFRGFQGNPWRLSDTPAKYVGKEGGPIELYIEVITIPGLISPELRYEVHGFEVSEFMVENFYDFQLKEHDEAFAEFTR